MDDAASPAAALAAAAALSPVPPALELSTAAPAGVPAAASRAAAWATAGGAFRAALAFQGAWRGAAIAGSALTHPAFAASPDGGLGLRHVALYGTAEAAQPWGRSQLRAHALLSERAQARSRLQPCSLLRALTPSPLGSLRWRRCARAAAARRRRWRARCGGWPPWLTCSPRRCAPATLRRSSRPTRTAAARCRSCPRAAWRRTTPARRSGKRWACRQGRSPRQNAQPEHNRLAAVRCVEQTSASRGRHCVRPHYTAARWRLGS